MSDYATPRQVNRAARMLGRYARDNRMWELSFTARTYVTANKRTHTVSRTKLAMLSQAEMKALLRDLKR